MNARLVLSACFVISFIGCALNTAGQANDEEDQAPADIAPDVIEADIGESDASELVEADLPLEAADEAAPETEAGDEEAGDEVAEDAHDVTDESDEGDGEITDPCAPPEIPPTGLYLFFCITSDRWPTNLHLERRVDRSGTGLPDDPWSVEPGCAATGARSLFCEVHLTGPGTMIFGVHLTYAWACEHLATPYTHGTPRLWWNGAELVLEDPVWNGVDGSDGCQYTLSLPTP